MFSLKIFNKNNNNSESERTKKNIISYVLEKLRFKDASILSDNSSVEIVSGKEIIQENNDCICFELVIRKNIIINNKDLSDKEKLDEYITKIKHFCDQAKSIEELKYLPIHLR